MGRTETLPFDQRGSLATVYAPQSERGSDREPRGEEEDDGRRRHGGPREGHAAERTGERSRHEPAGLFHVGAVPVAEARDHAPLFILREQVVERDHDGPERSGQEARPEDRQTDPRRGERHVLGMADPAVEPPQRGSPARELVEVDLAGADQEDERPAQEQHGARHPHRPEEGVGRHHHVRKEEGGEPPCGRPPGHEEKHRVERGIEESREGADHDEHFERDDEVEGDRAAKNGPGPRHPRLLGIVARQSSEELATPEPRALAG